MPTFIAIAAVIGDRLVSPLMPSVPKYFLAIVRASGWLCENARHDSGSNPEGRVCLKPPASCSRSRLDWQSESRSPRFGRQTGRAHYCTPVTNEHFLTRLLLDTNKT